MTLRRALLGSLLALCATGCPPKAAAPADVSVVASVNGEVLTRQSVEEELARELRSIDIDGESQVTPESVEPYKRALLQNWIERAVLLQAAREAAIVVEPEEVDRRMLRISSDYPPDGFEAALEEGRLSVAELRAKTRATITIEKLFESTVYPRVAVTEEEIRAWFEAHREEYQEPEQVRASQIVVKGMDDARKVQAQLRAGKKFPELARKYSLSADAKVGGDLGFFGRGVMPAAFDEVAFRLGVGQVSDVVITDYGYHLFRVTEKKPARKKELFEVRAEVERKLTELKRSSAQQEYVEALKAKAKIEVNEPALLLVTGRKQ